ncbi:hypothetical protein WICPIJ_006594 [Wickerhamomyces pijperi]|uniref:Uncharacterized protein n=1 Tax=Wickerhamomyces pijperi TaxID=599730 RepID=A0A9P8Q3H7_WICPI|nr:hypothetical protein WICPIJ_006594 [Wickerhamomyces pijperi]
MTSTTLKQQKPSQKKSVSGSRKQLNTNSANATSTSKSQSTATTPKASTPSPDPFQPSTKPVFGGWASIAAGDTQPTAEKTKKTNTPESSQTAKADITESKSREKSTEKKPEPKKSSRSSSPETISDSTTTEATSTETSVESQPQLPSFNRDEILKYLQTRSSELNKSAIPYKSSGSDWTTTASKHSNNKKGRGNSSNHNERERDVVAWELSKLVQRS